MKFTRCVCGRKVEAGGLMLCDQCYENEKNFREITPPSICYACGVDLKRVFPESPYDQCDGAMSVRFIGGYGMFFDPVPPDDKVTDALICQKCAEEMVEKLPWVARLIKESEYGPEDGYDS